MSRVIHSPLAALAEGFCPSCGEKLMPGQSDADIQRGFCAPEVLNWVSYERGDSVTVWSYNDKLGTMAVTKELLRVAADPRFVIEYVVTHAKHGCAPHDFDYCPAAVSLTRHAPMSGS